jgi:hypothetical protein
MARRSRSRSRDLAGLAALGALSYSIFGPEGRRRKDGSLAPVEDRGRAATPGESSVAPVAAPVRQQFSDLQDMHKGLGPLADTGGVGRSEGIEAADQTGMPPPVTAAPVTRGFAPAAAPAARRAPASTSQLLATDADFMPSRLAQAPVSGPRSGGIGGATAAEVAALERQRAAEANLARGINRAATIGTRSTGAGGATAQELEAYRRQQEELARRNQRSNTSRFKEGGAVKTKKMASGGVSSASKRADGIATKGKTKCKMY